MHMNREKTLLSWSLFSRLYKFLELRKNVLQPECTELLSLEIQHSHSFLHSLAHHGPDWPKYPSRFHYYWIKLSQCLRQVNMSSEVQTQRWKPETHSGSYKPIYWNILYKIYVTMKQMKLIKKLDLARDKTETVFHVMFT